MKHATTHSKGYVLIPQAKHPFTNSSGYVPEHRLIMEGSLGRYINPKIEDVHHKDGNEQNNLIDNLVLLTKSEHRRIHSGWRVIDGEWWKPCGHCGRFLKAENSFYKRNTGHEEYVSQCVECVRSISKSHHVNLTKQQRSNVAKNAANKGWITRRMTLSQKEGGVF